MKVIIVGAGNVGFTIAETLSAVHDVLVIEKDAGRAESVKDLLNVSVLHEDGTNPVVLRDTLDKHNADFIVSALSRDDANLFVCMISKMLRPAVKTVARVRHPDFIMRSDAGILGADQIISPEQITAKKLAILALLENAVDYEHLDSMGLAMATFLVTKEHTDMIGKVVINLDMPRECTIMSIYRNNEVILFSETAELRAGDGICVLGSTDAIKGFNAMMGRTRETKEIVILGGGVIGAQTAKILGSQKKYVKIIESDAEKSRKLAREFDNVLVVNGNAVDPHVLRSENIGRADVLISATDSDEKNLLASLISMEMGAGKVISRYTMREYEEVFRYTGIRITVGYHLVVDNEITKTMITDERSILRMKHEGELFFSIIVKEGSKIAGSRVGDIKLPSGARIICIIRNEEKIYPRMDTMLAPGDKTLLFAYKADLPKLGRMLDTEIS